MNMLNKCTDTLKRKQTKSTAGERGGERGVLLSVYLAGSSIKAVRQKFQLSHGSDLGGHLNHPDQLSAVQTPQVEQVGAPTSSKALTITANTSQVYQCFYVVF